MKVMVPSLGTVREVFFSRQYIILKLSYNIGTMNTKVQQNNVLSDRSDIRTIGNTPARDARPTPFWLGLRSCTPSRTSSQLPPRGKF